MELAGLREDGDGFPLELSLSHWNIGLKRDYTAIIREITERKREERALRQSKERLRKLLNSAPDAIVVIDSDGKISAWNRGPRKIFGYEEHGIIGANVTTLIPERHRTNHEAGMQRLQLTGEACLMGKSVDLDGLRKDGSEFPLELSLGTWSAGTETLFSAIFRDTSTRKPGAAPRSS